MGVSCYYSDTNGLRQSRLNCVLAFPWHGFLFVHSGARIITTTANIICDFLTVLLPLPLGTGFRNSVGHSKLPEEFVGIREQKLGTQRLFVALFCLNFAVFVGRLTRFVSPTVATTTILSNLDARKGIIIWARLIWTPARLSRSDLYIDAKQYISALKSVLLSNS